MPSKLTTRMVLVVFKDSASFKELCEEELKEATLPYYFAIGFLVKETPDTVVLSQGYLPSSFPFDLTIYRNVLFIPKISIESMHLLKTVEAKEK